MVCNRQIGKVIPVSINTEYEHGALRKHWHMYACTYIMAGKKMRINNESAFFQVNFNFFMTYL